MINISEKTVRLLLSNNTTHTSGKTNFGEEACQQRLLRKVPTILPALVLRDR